MLVVLLLNLVQESSINKANMTTQSPVTKISKIRNTLFCQLIFGLRVVHEWRHGMREGYGVNDFVKTVSKGLEIKGLGGNAQNGVTSFMDDTLQFWILITQLLEPESSFKLKFEQENANVPKFCAQVVIIKDWITRYCQIVTSLVIKLLDIVR